MNADPLESAAQTEVKEGGFSAVSATGTDPVTHVSAKEEKNLQRSVPPALNFLSEGSYSPTVLRLFVSELQ